MQRIPYIPLLATMLFLCSCGNNATDETVETMTDTVQTITIEQEPVIFTGPNYAAFPQTLEELQAMPVEELKEVIIKNIPNYREYFIIDKTLELTDDDWENLRTIISLEMFGTTVSDVSAIIPETEEEEEYDSDSIYYAPTKEYISGLSDEEFAEYLSGLQEYLQPGSEKIDYSQLTSEQLQIVKEELLSGL